MESSTSQKTTIPKKQARRSRGRKAQTNPVPPSSTTPPTKILQRNNKKINIAQPMVMSPRRHVEQVEQELEFKLDFKQELDFKLEFEQQQHDYTLTEALDDVLIRFILNCPEEEHESLDRLFFQIEEAHWFYEDFYRENCKTLPELKFKEFVEKIFAHCPLLAPYRSKVDAHTQSFYQYKTSVPVCGAIILNETLDKVLLVKGWSNKSSWSFPRGKINRDEPALQCAIREVFEETGFDISQHGANDKDFVEMVLGEQRVKLFIVTGISEDTVFVPQTRKEISATEWHTFEKILERSPTTQKTSGKYWPVIPFVRKVKKWIGENKKRFTRQSRNKKNVGKRNGKKQQQPLAGHESPDMMSLSPPHQILTRETLTHQTLTHQTLTHQALTHQALTPQAFPPSYPSYYPDQYGYAATYPPQPQQVYDYYYPQQQSMKTGSSDSLLSFSFNMNEIFEDSAVQNVVA
jgi:mRNA-decapping enzyme subunit 2